MLVRHGEADHNVLQEQRSGSGVILNDVIDTDLTENGRDQARRVALRLKEERFDLVAEALTVTTLLWKSAGRLGATFQQCSAIAK